MEDDDIIRLAKSFQHWDNEVARLESQLEEAKRMRSDFREKMLNGATRYELDEI